MRMGQIPANRALATGSRARARELGGLAPFPFLAP